MTKYFRFLTDSDTGTDFPNTCWCAAWMENRIEELFPGADVCVRPTKASPEKASAHSGTDATADELAIIADLMSQWKTEATAVSAATLGHKGRAVNSEAQQAAARANGAKGGRPRYNLHAMRALEGAQSPATVQQVVHRYATHRRVAKVHANGLRKIQLLDDEERIVSVYTEGPEGCEGEWFADIPFRN